MVRLHLGGREGWPPLFAASALGQEDAHVLLQTTGTLEAIASRWTGSVAVPPKRDNSAFILPDLRTLFRLLDRARVLL